MFENPRRGRQARNFTTNVPKILDRKSSSKQIFSENCRWVPLILSEKNPYFGKHLFAKQKLITRTSFVHKSSRLVRISLLINSLNKSFSFFLGKVIL